MSTGSLDLLEFTALTPTSLSEACAAAMAACNEALAAVSALPAHKRTFLNTMLAIEEAVEPVLQASGQYAFMAHVAADDALRTVAREWDEKLDRYLVGLSFREDLYHAVQEFAATAEAAGLAGEDARLLAFELRDYRRNGLELEPADRERLRAIFDELVAIGVQFRNAIDDWDDGITAGKADLAGLPESFIGGLERVGESGEERFRVSLDYPELHPFLANAESEPLRRELFLKDQRKGGEENVRRLERAIALRQEAATLLGYDSWASYAVEPRMAHNREAVDGFLNGLRPRLAAKAAHDLAALSEASVAHRGVAEVRQWDWRFYHNRLLWERYAVDEFEVARYFPLEACLDGLFQTTQALFGIRYEPAAAPRWHPDVQAFDIYDRAGADPIARFYMDLFPRPNKYGHAAAFTLRHGRRRADGSYQRPVSAIVANFTRPTAAQPSLLRHGEVVVLFHEFGHILHQTLTRAEHARFSGTSTERDFVEAPSQMLEHLCWEPGVLRSFSRHVETGEPLPEELAASLVAARDLDSGVAYLRQLYFAALDFAYHSPGFDGDTTAMAARLHDITSFPFPPDTHFQSGFGHLFGYDAGYYGYLWSRVFGDDMYTRFEAAGPFDPGTGLEYRRSILEPGGSVDGRVMVREFLGREPRTDAFFRGLGLAE